MTEPRLLRLGFNRPDEPLRVYLSRDTGDVVATFDDFTDAHRWLKDHGYNHSPVNGGLWIKR